MENNNQKPEVPGFNANMMALERVLPQGMPVIEATKDILMERNENRFVQNLISFMYEKLDFKAQPGDVMGVAIAMDQNQVPFWTSECVKNAMALLADNKNRNMKISISGRGKLTGVYVLTDDGTDVNEYTDPTVEELQQISSDDKLFYTLVALKQEEGTVWVAYKYLNDDEAAEAYDIALENHAKMLTSALNMRFGARIADEKQE